MKSTTRIQYPAIGILSLSHMMNDFYSNYLPQMLPFLIVIIPGFTVTQAAILVSAFTIASSFVQPLFGYFLDGKGQRWLVYVGTLWMAIMLSMTGIVHSYPVLVLLAALAGLGTAAFHPQASTMVNLLSGDRKAVLLSAFVASGNFGFAFGPLLLIPLFQRYGLHATLVTIVPGILVALLLLLYAPRVVTSSGAAPTLRAVATTLRTAARELSALVGVIAIRSLAYTGMLTILPLYFRSRHLSNIAASHL
ncbi:MAG TPA: MFS transporter, partial [Spirochaetia bacterium]|nr:MFS transporter [Spirochaetia bacterium]